MDKHYNYTSNPQQWVDYVTNLRGVADAALLTSAVELYPSTKIELLGKGLAIADILFSLGLDTLTLATVISYPALQAQLIPLDDVIEKFGESSRRLLNDVTQMQSLERFQQVEPGRHQQTENMRKMLLAMVSDVRAVLIVLAERLWQLRQAKNLPRDSQLKLAQETYEVYAPLANRLGVWQLKWEIEDLCLRYLEPEVYISIAKGLAARRVEREAYIERMITILNEILQAGQVRDFQISGRVKHIYSIYKKMQRKNATFKDIYDISALRVLVPTIEDCYSVLSILQNTWSQVHEEFDDYIMNPKPNGYQSIHTVVVGPENHFVEIQIRTFQMHQESELGVAAHWRYKEGVLQATHYEAKIALLRQVMAWQKEIAGSEEKAQSVEDIFADRVYVFTPTGDIIDLPKGSTPLDFAYLIHSEVGHRCRGAKIDGHMVSLKYVLQTGQRIEILTAKHANPSRDWINPSLGYIKTSRARAKVQHWFRLQENMPNITLAREALDKEIKRLGITDRVDLNAIAHKLHFKNPDDLLTALAQGEIRTAQIIQNIQPAEPPPVTQILPRLEKERAPSIQIHGVNNLLTNIARCCKPLPGDHVIGYITQNRGISIHRRNCNNILMLNENHKNRLIEVDWGGKDTTTYPVDLLLRANDRSDLIRDITNLFANEKIKIIGLQTTGNASLQQIDIYLTIQIPDVARLEKSLERLQQISGIIDVRRQ